MMGMSPSKAIEIFQMRVRAAELELENTKKPKVIDADALLQLDIRSPDPRQKWGDK